MKTPQKTLEPLGIKKLSNKELVTVARKGKHFTYFPKITKEAYTQAFFREKLEKEFGISSFEGMVAAFCGRTALTPDEEERVRQLLKELRDDV